LNRCDYTVDILNHVIVPETQHPKSGIAELTIPPHVFHRLVVLSAVHLDNDHFRTTDEIADKTFDRFLPNKLVPVDQTITDTIPQNGFGASLVRSQPARDRNSPTLWTTHREPLTRREDAATSPRKNGARLHQHAGSGKELLHKRHGLRHACARGAVAVDLVGMVGKTERDAADHAAIVA
jgi:hypothetical protein